MNVLLSSIEFAQIKEIIVLSSATAIGNNKKCCSLFHGSLAPMIFSSIKYGADRRLHQLLLDSNSVTWVNQISFSSINSAQLDRLITILSQKRYISVSVKSVTIPFEYVRDPKFKQFLVSHCPRIETIFWHDLSCLNDDDVEFFCSNFSSLSSFLLDESPITPIGIQHFSKLKKLKELSFYKTQLNDECLAVIGSSSCLINLESLIFHQCQSFTDVGVRHLSKLPRLRNLCVFGSMIRDEGLEHISFIETLEILDLGRCDYFTENGLRHLANLNNLQELDLSYCEQVTNSGLQHLLDCPFLKFDKLVTRLTNITNEALEEFRMKLKHK
jgi:hypothetical protein